LPGPASGHDPILDELFDEIANRLQAGESVDLEAYVRDHPAQAERLRQLLPAMEVLAGLGRSAARGEAVADSLAAPVDLPCGVLGDFRIVGEVGRGGMGIVYEAEQISLHRRVALKVLPLAATLDPRHLQRFHNEAQAAAGLHHTNIVPVYAVGCERGMHFYAMQFIDGQSLAAVIRQLRHLKGKGTAPAPGGSDQPTKDYKPLPPAPAAAGPTVTTQAALTREGSTDSPAYFRTVARLGEQAALALEHAHQLGVVHRDIKPANLLVDGRGDLWVTDFGLAHCQNQVGLTLTGHVVGTLRYMSPEQALGKRTLVDPRTDVYSLGVTLYELLTLEPAYTGEDREALLRQIAFEEPPPPRRRNREIPVDLETIVLKATAKEPEARYATAQELAADLERFLKDEPIRARRPTLVQRARKWARRHKPVVVTATTLLLTMLLLAGGGGLWLLGQRVARDRDVSLCLEEAERWEHQGNWPQALRAAERAEGRLAGGGPAALRRRAEQIRERVQFVADLEESRLQSSAAGQEVFDHAGADRAYAEAFKKHGWDVQGRAAEELAEQIVASPIRVHLVAALDDWANIKPPKDVAGREKLRAIAGLADDDGWRRQLRDPAVLNDRTALERLARQENVLDQRPSSLVWLAVALGQREAHSAAADLLSRAQQRHPDDFWINLQLAHHLYYEKPPRFEDAVRFFQVAVALRPQSPGSYNHLGVALADHKKLAEGEAAFRKAIALKPDYPGAHYNLGKVLDLQGKLAEAEAAYRKAIALKSDYPGAYTNLGSVLHLQGKRAEAEAAHRKAIDLRGNFPEAHYNLGNALLDQGKRAEAEAAYRKAIDLRGNFPEAHHNLGNALLDQGKRAEAEAAYGKAIDLKPDLAEAHDGLGVALREQGKVAGAEAAYRKAIALKPNYPEAHCNLGVALLDQGKRAEAEAAYRKAIALKPDYPGAYTNLGRVLHLQGKLAEAEAACRKAIALKPNYPYAHCNLGVALLDQGKRAEAEAAHRKAIDLKPDLAEAHNGLGVALREQGKVAGAEAAFRKAIALQPNYPEAHCNLGVALLDQGKRAEAEAAYRKAIALQPDNPQAYYNLGNALRDQRNLAGAEAAFRKAIALQPDYPEAHCNLGSVLRRQGRFAEAVASLRRGHELGSKVPGWPYPSAQWVRQAEQLLALDAKLPKLLKGDAQPAGVAEQLALADLCQQPYKRLYAAAARFYADAFAAEPKLADDLRFQHRYNAACDAALAGCGQGKDAAKLDDKERTRLRRQAVDWLRADLAAWTKLLDRDPKQARAVAQTLQHWQAEADLAGLRDKDALAKLPEAEQVTCQKLWADVRALLNEVQKKK
jgi:Flp pilus assembly protein TadD/serine/threonine protein kinase